MLICGILERTESKHLSQLFVAHQLQCCHRYEPGPDHEETSIQREGSTGPDHGDPRMDESSVHLLFSGLVHEDGAQKVERCYTNRHHETRKEGGRDLTPKVKVKIMILGQNKKIIGKECRVARGITS